MWAAVTLPAALAYARAGEWSWDDSGYLFIQGALVATGVLILVNRPGHVVGRLFFIAGASFTIAYALGALAPILEPRVRDVFTTVLLAMATLWAVLVAWGMLYFPDGALPSPRWRWVERFFWLSTALACLAPLINGGWGGDTSDGDFSPWHEAFAPWGDLLSDAFFLALNVGLVLVVAAAVLRFRRGRGEERQQLKWVLWAVFVAITWALIDLLVFGSTAQQGWRSMIGTATIAIVPLSVALAIIKYRLYDVDRVISRTVSYVLVVGLLGAVFAAGVVWIPQALTLDDAPLLVAASTLAVAGLFNPVRRRVQSIVDRRFNRSRYDAETVIEVFTSDLRAVHDLPQIVAGLGGVVEETLQPESVGVWVADET